MDYLIAIIKYNPPNDSYNFPKGETI